MRRAWMMVMVVGSMLGLAGCGTGLFGTSTEGGFATRVLAGLTCAETVSRLAGGLQADPDLGAATATDVANAIAKITDATKVATANEACADTLKYALEDFKGLLEMSKSKATATETAPQRKARLAKVLPKAQAGPVILHVPLGK